MSVICVAILVKYTKSKNLDTQKFDASYIYNTLFDA